MEQLQSMHTPHPDVFPHGDGYKPEPKDSLKETIDAHIASLSGEKKSIFEQMLGVLDQKYESLSGITPAELAQANREHEAAIRDLIETVE